MEPENPVAPQPWRITATLAAFAGLFGVLAWRLHHLQVEQAPALTGMVERQLTRTRTIPAPRGTIYDGDGAPLVVSEATSTLFADPEWMEDKTRATVEVSRILGIDRAELRAHFESPRNGRVVARGIREPEPGETDKAEAIRKLRIAGLHLVREYTRIPKETVAPHVLGFTLTDGSGALGVEQSLDALLKGEPGRETVRLDAKGRPDLGGGESVPPRAGANVQLTIVLPVQRLLEQAVSEAADKYAPRNIAAIVLRPWSGEILAMASWPAFDLTDRSHLDPATLRNNVLTFPYEPGSTMKPLIAGAAVAEKLASWPERIDCEHGAWTYRWGRGARTIHEKSGGHGILSLIEGIAFSDNIMMAKLGIRLGPERLKDWVERLRFGRRTGINLPGEETGVLPGGRAWNPLDACMSVPMGHGLMATPLQMAMGHAAVANGGTWMAPRIVRRVWRVGADGIEHDEQIPALPEPARVYTPEDALQIQGAMNRTMEDGTGKRSRLDGYTSAGKTGTAEKVIDGRYSNEHNVGSFVCWAPAEPGVRAEVLTLVVVDDPSKNGRFGSEVAAPVVQQVMQGTLEYLRVPKREPPTAEVVRPPGRRRGQ